MTDLRAPSPPSAPSALSAPSAPSARSSSCPADDEAPSAGGAGLVAGLAELTLETTDLAGLERFYTETLGLEVIDRQDDRVWLALGESTRLGLWAPGKKEFGDEGGRHVHFAISVTPDSLDQLVERLEAAGTKHEGPVEHPGDDRSLYFRDPAGNLVEAWDFFKRGEGAREGVDAL